MTSQLTKTKTKTPVRQGQNRQLSLNKTKKMDWEFVISSQNPRVFMSFCLLVLKVFFLYINEFPNRFWSTQLQTTTHRLQKFSLFSFLFKSEILSSCRDGRYQDHQRDQRWKFEEEKFWPFDSKKGSGENSNHGRYCPLRHFNLLSRRPEITPGAEKRTSESGALIDFFKSTVLIF